MSVLPMIETDKSPFWIARNKAATQSSDMQGCWSIVPMQIRVIKHIRKVYGCRGCEAAPVTADKPAQLIEKSMASPSVLAMLLTTKYVDGLPLHRFETVLARHGVDIPRQTLARWVIQCGEHLQPLLNLMRDRLLESPVIHCDETRVQVLKEPDRDPTSQSWMWVQASGPRDRKVVLFNYTSSRAQEVSLRLHSDTHASSWRQERSCSFVGSTLGRRRRASQAIESSFLPLRFNIPWKGNLI